MKHYHNNNYNLYITKNKKFKTVSLSVHFKKEIEREDVVYFSILKSILKEGSNNYKNIKDYYRAKLAIYNPYIGINTVQYGREISLIINTKFTDEKYTEIGMNEKTLNFVFDMIYNPKVFKESFSKETFEIAQHDYVEYLKSAKDDPFMYAKNRLWEEINIHDFKTLKREEAIEIAQKLTSKDLYKYYNKLFEQCSLDIFMIGDLNYTNIKNIVAKKIKGNFKKNYRNRIITHQTPKIKEITESIKTNQSQLGIGLKFVNLTDFERKYVSLFYVSILGGGWNSKLFRVVREKHSLCYYIGATRYIPFNLFTIAASIDAKDYEETLKLIKKEINSMKKGDFDEQDMAKVREIYNNSLLEIEDNQGSILNNIIDTIITDADSNKEKKQNIEKVTKEDIINIAKKVHYDTIYFLKGEK